MTQTPTSRFVPFWEKCSCRDELMYQ